MLPKYVCILRLFSLDGKGQILFLTYLRWVWFHCCYESLDHSSTLHRFHTCSSPGLCVTCSNNTLCISFPHQSRFLKTQVYFLIPQLKAFLWSVIIIYRGNARLSTHGWSLAYAAVWLYVLHPISHLTFSDFLWIPVQMLSFSTIISRSCLQTVFSYLFFRFLLHKSFKKGWTLVPFALSVYLTSKEQQIRNGSSKGVEDTRRTQATESTVEGRRGSQRLNYPVLI